MNATEPWSNESISSKTVLENLREQMQHFREQFGNVPCEFAGTSTSCARFERRIARAGGKDLDRGTTFAEFRIFGIPIIEDPEVPDGQIRIRYRDGRESVIYLE